MAGNELNLLAEAVLPATHSGDAGPMSAAMFLILAGVAAIGTLLLLPGRRERAIRIIGGGILSIAGIVLALLVGKWAYDSSPKHPWMPPYFYVFAAIALVAAFRVITHSKPVYSALYFVLTVFATAGLFVLLWAEFMAAALVLIYAGAILVTYVFVIMLASEAANNSIADHDTTSRDPVAACAVGFALIGVLLFVIFDRYQPITAIPAEASSIVTGGTQQLGAHLFKSNLLAIEVSGVLLTISMVGAIIIARRNVLVSGAMVRSNPEVVLGPFTPTDDSPNSIAVYGTTNPRQKAYPET